MKKQTTITKWVLMPLAILALNTGLIAQDAQAYAAQPDFFGRTTQQDLTKLPKMERDIVILQNVLNDLFNGDRGSFYSSRGAKGIYVPGKGVIFNVGSAGSDYNIIFAEQIAIGQSGKAVAKEDEKSAAQKNQEREAKLESLSKEFLVNYGSILSDLKSGEQVMLNVNYSAFKDDKEEGGGVTVRGTGSSNLIYRGRARVSQKRMVTSIDYAAIDSYLNGNSSLDAASKKIKQSIIDQGDNTAQDAKIMAGILDDLFQSNFEGAFRRSGKTSWTYFEGFGLMYDLSLTGNQRGGLLTYVADGTRVTNVDRAEKEDKEPEENKAEENYDDLMDLIKESLITYGRTLRSVKSDEVVILNINFGSSFRKSSLPKAIRLQVTKDQIEAYSKGNRSLDQLKKEIDITKLSASTSGLYNSTHYDFPGNVYEVAPGNQVESTVPVVIGNATKVKGN